MPMAILIIGAIGLAAELGLRVVRRLRSGEPVFSRWPAAAPKSAAFESHPYALYVKRAHQRGRYPSNNLGYVGTREVPAGRIPGSVRIVCAGGSTTELVDPAQGPDSSWPAKLQDRLQARFPGTPIECLNAGAAGYTTAESFAEFCFRGVDLQPDLLLVYHNVNDAWTCQMVEGFKPDYSHARRHKPWTLRWGHRLPERPWLATYQVLRDALSLWWLNRLPQRPGVPGYRGLRRRLMRRFGAADGLLHYVSDPPWRTARRFDPARVMPFERNMTNLASVALAWGCIPVLIKWECDWSARFLPYYLERSEEAIDAYRRYLQANNDALRRVAERVPGCVYLEAGPFAPEHFFDTIHFTAVGLEEMARRMADALEPLIRRLPAARTVSGRGAHPAPEPVPQPMLEEAPRQTIYPLW